MPPEFPLSPPEPRTLFAKLWDAHVVASLSMGEDLIAIDRVLLHERTGSVALRSLAGNDRRVADVARVFVVTDHIVDTLPGRTGTLVPGGEAFLSATREECARAGIRLFDVNDPDQGIVHVISPELGIVLPGVTLVCPDSHTCSQGALGALAWGIGSTEAEHAMATGTLRLKRPRTMRVIFDGKLQPGVTPKDMMLALIATYGAAGGAGHALEFAGAVVRALDVEGRLTLCNMATEFAAMTGFVAPDETVFAYLRGRRYAPRGAGWYAMRCFTASAVAINRASENPHGMNTGAIREKAKHAHDVAYQMGAVLGMTQQQVSDDFDHVQAAEARLLTSQPSYYARTKADCIKLGLM